jgi:hypothetical protein
VYLKSKQYNRQSYIPITKWKLSRKKKERKWDVREHNDTYTFRIQLLSREKKNSITNYIEQNKVGMSSSNSKLAS